MSERDRLLDAMAPGLLNRAGATVAKRFTLEHQTGSGRTAIRKMVRLTSGESYSETALNAAIKAGLVDRHGRITAKGINRVERTRAPALPEVEASIRARARKARAERAVREAAA